MERIPFENRNEVPTEKVILVNDLVVDVPKFDYPVSPRENFRRIREFDHPYWVPSGMTDFNYCQGGDLTGLSDLRYNFGRRCVWVDLFGCEWEFIPEAGGSMLCPDAKPVLDDITEWKEKIVWPTLDEERIRKSCEEVMSRPTYHSDRMNYFDIGQGCTERLVAVLGGYVEAMIAFAEEPEACAEFMMELTRFHIRMLDLICKYYPVDMILYHDDWGTEKDTFFSPAMLESMVLEPTALFFDHVRKLGLANTFHTCGNIMRFLPYINDLKPDFLQLQARANDMAYIKETYGDHIGFNFVLRPDPGLTIQETMRSNIDKWAAGGGLFATIFGSTPEMLWDGLQELYCYSREYYNQ